MNAVYFKIIKAYPEAKGVDVQFYTDLNPTGATLHVTIYPSPVPTGDALNQYILGAAPLAWLAAMDETLTQTPPDLSAVQALEGAVFKATLDEQTIAQITPAPMPASTDQSVIAMVEAAQPSPDAPASPAQLG